MRRRAPGWLWLIGVLVLAASVHGQQAGSIRGVVNDADFNEPLPKATVSIAGSDRETTTGSEGNYVFHDVDPGSYTLVFSKRGYTREVKSGVVVEAGKLAEADARLSGGFAELSEFVVRDLQLAPGSEAALLNLRMESPQMLDSISADLMSSAGAGDAAEALKLVAGTTTSDDKAVVRGLPDRYVSSQLNGVRLPSADPKTRSVELDQFPSDVIESIRVSKTFTPDQQGDASGGAVNIVTKSIPEKTIFQVGTGTSVNSQVLGADDDFLSYRGGGIDGFGLDDDRDQNAGAQAINQLADVALGVSPGEAPVEYGVSMTAGGSHELTDKVRIGGLLSLFRDQSASFFDNGEDNSLWLFDNSTGDLIPISSGSEGDPSRLGPNQVPEPGDTQLLDIEQGKEQMQWGGLATFGVELEGHELGFKFLHTRTIEDIATLAEDTRGKQFFFPGHDPNDPTSPGFTDPPLDERGANDSFPTFLLNEAPYGRLETVRRVERTLQTIQFDGTHTVPVPDWAELGPVELLDAEIGWTVSLNEAEEDEPDKRQFASKWTPRLPAFEVSGGFTNPEIPAQHRIRRPATGFSLGNIQRTFETTREEGEQFSAHFKLPFEQWNDREGFLEVGFFDDSVDRTFEQESFSNFFDSNNPPGNITFEAPFGRFFSAAWPDRVPNANDFEPNRGDIDYRGAFDIRAWYGMVDMPVTAWLKAIGGARFESTDIRTVTDPERDASIVKPNGTRATVWEDFEDGVRARDAESGLPLGDAVFEQDDVLPAFALLLTPHEDVTVRGSYAETIARQTFREITPIQQQEFLGGDTFIGNPNLDASSVENWDLRVDYRPAEGSLISVSGFLKDIQDPIEVVQRLPDDGSFVFDTPLNFPEGQLRGLEIEMRQDLDAFAEMLQGLSVGFNATLLDSEVTLPSSEVEILDNALGRTNAITERAMVNMPEQLINANIRYQIEETGTKLGLFYTFQGETLVAGPGQTSGRFVPSRFREPVGRLNFTLSQELWDHFTLSFKAENLTNPRVEEVFKSEFSETAVHTTFTEGIDYSVSLSAKFEF